MISSTDLAGSADPGAGGAAGGGAGTGGAPSVRRCPRCGGPFGGDPARRVCGECEKGLAGRGGSRRRWKAVVALAAVVALGVVIWKVSGRHPSSGNPAGWREVLHDGAKGSPDPMFSVADGPVPPPPLALDPLPLDPAGSPGFDSPGDFFGIEEEPGKGALIEKRGDRGEARPLPVGGAAGFVSLTSSAHCVQPGAKGEAVFEWTARIEGTEEDLGRISFVRYFLHSSFNPSEVDVYPDEDPQCPVSRSGWGEFTMKARVFLEDGSSTDLERRVEFPWDEATPVEEMK